MLLKEIEFYRRHAFAGIEIDRPGPPPPTGSEPDVRRRKTFTGTLDQICESNVLKAWTREVVPGPSKSRLKEAITTLKEQLRDITEKPFSLIEEVEPDYQKVGDRFPDIPFDGTEEIGPKNPALKTLLAIVDQLYGVNLTQRYHGLPTDWESKISPYVRYLIEAGLILANEACSPICLPGTIDPNVIFFNRRGKMVTQIDAILLSADSNIYECLELKTTFRLRYTTGKRRFTRVLQRDIAQFQDRLARLVLWWHQEIQTCPLGSSFLLPQALRLYYLRGSLSRVSHRIPLDYSFLERWADGLAVKLDQGYFRTEEIDDVSYLIEVLEREAESKAGQEAERRHQAFERLERLRTATFNQPELFTRPEPMPIEKRPKKKRGKKPKPVLPNKLLF
jgi:hypothetical protein